MINPIVVMIAFLGAISLFILVRAVYREKYRGNVKCIECRYFSIDNSTTCILRSCDHPDCYRLTEMCDPINGKRKERRRFEIESIYEEWNKYNNCKRSSRREDDYHGAR